MYIYIGLGAKLGSTHGSFLALHTWLCLETIGDIGIAPMSTMCKANILFTVQSCQPPISLFK